MSEGYGFVMGGLSSRKPATAPGEGEKLPIYQIALARYVAALIDAYGWRPDVIGTHRVPWMPAPFAEQILRYFHRAARTWLDRDDIPDTEKMPQLIENARDEATSQYGSVQYGNLVLDEARFEKAPEEVATKAPRLFPASMAAGRGSPLVMRGEPSFWFFYRLDKLATHLDKLRGVPKKFGNFLEDIGEGFLEFDRELTGQVRGGIRSGLQALVKLPNEMVIEPVKRGLSAMTIAAFALAVLYVVTRK